jgi:hypothetical protein
MHLIVDGIDDIVPKMKELEGALNKVDHSHCRHCGERVYELVCEETPAP